MKALVAAFCVLISTSALAKGPFYVGNYTAEKDGVTLALSFVSVVMAHGESQIMTMQVKACNVDDACNDVGPVAYEVWPGEFLTYDGVEGIRQDFAKTTHDQSSGVWQVPYVSGSGERLFTVTTDGTGPLNIGFERDGSVLEFSDAGF